jgi:hypothetical protein
MARRPWRALRQHLEADRHRGWRLVDRRPHPAARPFDDREPPAERPVEPGAKALVGGVGERAGDRGKALTEAVAHGLGGAPIVRVGRMDTGVQDEALGVDHQMPLAAADPFAAGVAALAAIDGAAVDRWSGRSGCRGSPRSAVAFVRPTFAPARAARR